MQQIVILMLSLLGLILSKEENYEETKIYERFQQFLKDHNKQYNSIEEHKEKYDIFKSNYLKVQYLQASSSQNYAQGVTKFSDMSPEEFRKKYLGLRPHRNEVFLEGSRSSRSINVDAPDSFDWRDRGVVGTPRAQGECGACWTFSVLTNIEGQYAIKYNKLISLSEQQLVDCDTENSGCDGGDQETAFEWLKKNEGIVPYESYPYTSGKSGKKHECKYDSSKVVVEVTGKERISEDEEEIKKALFSIGPLSVSINAAFLQFYENGIMEPEPEKCDGKTLDHAVAIVGYGTEDEKDYWIVKNSWDSDWGEKGYFRILRGKGLCGINLEVSTATIK